MKAKTHLSQNKLRGGFTLVEMLVVIGMIAALAGISFPVYRSIQKKVEMRQLQMLVTSMDRAVDNFETEYNYLPYFASSYPTADSNYKDSTGDVSKFFTELAGLTTISNFKQIKFLEGSAPKSGSAGIEVTATSAKIIDPWGNEFQRLRVDYDHSGTVQWHYGGLIAGCEDYDPVYKKIGLVSFGPDGKAGSWAGGDHLDNLHNHPTPWHD